jgi:hypothetical protein
MKAGLSGLAHKSAVEFSDFIGRTRGMARTVARITFYQVL